ncbi:hypothetical protein MIND_01145100 [Mycena indigotica]|uniref:CxC2-like cysteine cluster KDZ transposase-associated domain-containing protein n=1 Tax=Mycena indigotica TaxID=2126181 RepID=A0A8H6S8C0_9AGAR|nr:uncharacterized protein MIND_01145100 [Mycena indigotica]KAF7293652.1 hypothetical protein MIND_01145100 [Mycena indigotica]
MAPNASPKGLLPATPYRIICLNPVQKLTLPRHTPCSTLAMPRQAANPATSDPILSTSLLEDEARVWFWSTDGMASTHLAFKRAQDPISNHQVRISLKANVEALKRAGWNGTSALEKFHRGAWVSANVNTKIAVAPGAVVTKRARDEELLPKQRRKKRGNTTVGVRAATESDYDEAATSDVSQAASTSQSVPYTAPRKRQTKAKDVEARWNDEVKPQDTQPPPLLPDLLVSGSEMPTSEKITNPSAVKQGQAAAMSAILPLLPTVQKYILAGFTHRGLGAQPCQCGQEQPTFRCLDCFNSPLWCLSCVAQVHQLTPFHHIEEWDGQQFARRHYQQPIPIHPGFGGRECPHTSQTSRPPRTPLTICHETGLQEATIQWFRLFPASFKEPRTAFTFGVLKQFQVHMLASKKSAYDYIKALCQLTDNEAPDAVEKRYREFLFACRLWRYLSLERRTGQAHTFDQHVPHRRPHSLALRCPACPEIGFNITAETMDSALETERHKYTLFVSADGNFKLQRKNKRDDPNGIALNGGNAFFGPKHKTAAYVEKMPKSEDPGTYSHLKASKMQNTAKFKNCVISGVVAIQCGRHGFYLPQAMIDLLKGEGFGYTDFALKYGLGTEAHGLRWIMLTYDIWCQYRIKLLERIRAHFPEMLPIFEKVDGAIGKLHVLTHQQKCEGKEGGHSHGPYKAI